MLALHTRGRLAWPGLDVDFQVFASFMRSKGEIPPLDTLNAADLYLACACALGNPRALALFDAHQIAPLDATLRRVDASARVVEDVKQLMRIRFLAREDGQVPRIAGYSGVGEMRSWLRVAAVRIAISLQRQHGREEVARDDELLEVPTESPSPELELLRQKYRHEFARAFASALRALTPRERNVLRHQVLDRLTIDQIGALHAVHRATAARWVAGARARLVAGLRRELAAQLGVARDELDSCLGLLQSHLDLSLRQFWSTQG